MSVRRALVLLSAWSLLALLLAGCGDDDDGAQPTATPTDATPGTGDPTPGALEQLAIWPAPGEGTATPQEAAADFVASVLGVAPALGEFQQGDARSGEIAVLSPREGGGQPLPRGVLLLRRLGADDGWYVLAAANAHAAVTSPAAGAEVPAAQIAVDGIGRGFEGAVTVSAYRVGDPTPLDQVATQGGSMADAAPFSVTLDVSGAEPGETVLLLVQGGVGLETDPGDFGAIPVVIG